MGPEREAIYTKKDGLICDLFIVHVDFKKTYLLLSSWKREI